MKLIGQLPRHTSPGVYITDSAMRGAIQEYIATGGSVQWGNHKFPLKLIEYEGHPAFEVDIPVTVESFMSDGLAFRWDPPTDVVVERVGEVREY